MTEDGRRAEHVLAAAVVAVHAGLLGANLLLPWVHDETGRVAGWRVLLGGLDGSTEAFWPRVAALLVVCAAAVALVTAVRDARGARGGTDGSDGGAVTPDDGRWVAAWWTRRRPPRPRCQVWAWRSGALCLLAALLSGWATLGLERRADVGVPAATVLAGVGVGLWIAQSRWCRPRPTPPDDARVAGSAGDGVPVAALGRPWWRRGATAGGALAMALVVTVVAAAWWTTGRHMDATTTTQSPSGPAGGPDEIDGVAWSSAADAVVVAQRDVVLDRGREVTVVDASTGVERWHYHDDALVEAKVSPTEDVVVVSLWLDRGLYELVALDLATGEELWRHRTDSELTQVVDDLVFVVERDDDSLDEALVARNAADGTVAWRQRTVLDDNRPETWRHSGDALVGLGPGAGQLVAVAWSSGEELWRVDAGETDLLPYRAVGGAGGVVAVVGSVAVEGGDELDLQEAVVAIDAATGQELWREPVGLATANPVVVVEGRFVIGVDQDTDPGLDRLVARDPRSGVTAWSQDLSNVAPDRPVFALGADDDSIYLATGTDGGRDSTIVVLDADGQVGDEAVVPGCTSRCRDGVVVADAVSDLDAGAVLLPAGGVLLSASANLTGEHSLTWYGDDSIAQVTALGGPRPGGSG